MMNEIIRRKDGSFVITKDGLPYHVPTDWKEWTEIDAYAKEHPEVVQDEPTPPEPTAKEVRAAALSRIDSATSAAILAGFEYEVEGEALHFSYDEHDQQNFADTANACLLTLSGVDGLPQSVVWNGWRNHNAESKGELVRLTLDVQTFLGLYTGGALVHKATQMEIGGQRKAAIEAAETVEEIEALLEGWGI